MYPALEVAERARNSEWEVVYLGSNRGIEKKSCERVEVAFEGFSSEPIYRLYTLRGFLAAVNMAKARKAAMESLKRHLPDVVFSTGGYASAPIVSAAKALGIPYVIHEQNTVPGRTNRILGQGAKAVCVVFESATRFFPEGMTHVTGMPIRASLRQSAQGSLPMTHSLEKAAPIVLVMGGSQGSEALNDISLTTAVRMASTPVQWVHVTGARYFERTSITLEKMAMKADYSVKAYLDADEMASALFSCSLVVSRSGAGTLAETAAFRKPAILIPYPQSFGDHQRLNAMEFLQMEAADIVDQTELNAAALEKLILGWLEDEPRCEKARIALAVWDKPDAADEILAILEEVAL